MNNFIFSTILVTSLFLSACGGQSESMRAEAERLNDANAKLQAEVASLKADIEELNQTPQVLLSRVNETLSADKPEEARKALAGLEKRFPDSEQKKAAMLALAKYVAGVAEREAQRKIMEAKGFFALQPQKTTSINGITVQVESVQIGKRWISDAYDSTYHYLDAERGESFVLLRTTIQSKEKEPTLPDFVVYRIDGKKMIQVISMSYAFRRWERHATYIGLYHDTSNDFAYSPSVPFSLAGVITEADANAPLALVSTGELCQTRVTKLRRPEVGYRRAGDCPTKQELTLDDFASGKYRVLAFFNRPRGV